jgi:hypothetical protein
MKRHFEGIFLASLFLLLALPFGNGCFSASVTLQGSKSLAPMHQVRRLFVIINGGILEKSPGSKKSEQLNSDVLAASLRNCLSTTPVQLEIGIVNPLALDDQNFKTKIQEFQADAVLIINLRYAAVDVFGGYHKILYDVVLHNEITDKYVWRVQISNSGDPEIIGKRLQQTAAKIVAQLRADGVFGPP